VIGAGIAGLSAAFRVRQLAPSARIIVLEGSERAGGKLGAASVAGMTVDVAADAFLARVEGAVELANELGLGGELIAPATGQAAVLVHGALRQLPAGLVLGVPTDLDALAASGILTADGLRAAQEDERMARPLDQVDRSVADAVAHHLGREVVERLVDPLIGGIAAAHTDRLSIDAVAPQIGRAACEPHLMAALRDQQAVAQRGQIGVTETRPVFLAPRGGVHQLTSRLEAELGDIIRFQQSALSIEAAGAASWLVRTASDTYAASSVILATPAPVSGRLLYDVAQLSARSLHRIRYASVALLMMAYRRTSVSLPKGSGMLVPRTEGRLVTAASWWDQKWPHLVSDDHVLIRASVGRIDDVRFTELDEDGLVRAVHHDLTSMAGVSLRADPDDVAVAYWLDSFAQYDVGHLDRIDHAERSLPSGVFLAGASLRGVGLPACIRSANEAAARAVGRLQE
jgi:protoporphyrinogen/coproporphyrinogen III oxidase